ncbi:MAG: VWA domain-containing protein [Bacteroidota bacterium]
MSLHGIGYKQTMGLRKYILVCLVLTGTLFNTLWAQPVMRPTKTRILFLLDASGSMYARMEKDSRINVAKRLLSNIVDSLEKAKNVELALRVYGHTSPPNKRDCKDTRLEVSFRKDNHAELKKRVQSISPKGTTLIAYSLQQAAYDFPKEPNTRNVIILITDGLEECQGDPCAVSEALQSQGVILKPFIIGLGSSLDFQKAFECVGRYYDANTEEQFNNVLNIVVSQALNNTTAQINLLDIYSRATESNVNMSFYDMDNGQLLYNYMHTINERGNPDTVQLDPLYKYKLVVHTIPQVVKENIIVSAGKHTIIGLDAPQGELLVKIDGVTNYEALKFIVKQAKENKILHVQNANVKEKYIVGKYDLEVLTLPRMHFKDVAIDQSMVTTIQIPQPGKLNITNQMQAYYMDIYQMIRGELVWIHKLPIDVQRHNITLQPGDYKLIYRAKGATRSNNTFARDFKIISGQANNITIN